MSISERLLELRKKNGDSQEQLADKLEVSRQAVSKWESGQGNPDLENVIKLSEIYGVSTDYILKGVPTAIEFDQSKTQMDPAVQKTMHVIMLVGGLSLISFLFIAGLRILSAL